MNNIFISPGHYEFTWEKEHAKGLIAPEGLFEEFDDFNIKVANYLVPLLKQHQEIFKIHQLEYDNNKLDNTLNQRINYINKICSLKDIIISIHANYSDNKNINGLWLLYKGSRSKRLTELYIKHSKDNLIPYTKTFECIDDGSWLDLGIVLKTHCPVILIEAGFFSNDKDRSILKSSKYQKQVATSIYKMICEYYNISPFIEIYNSVDISDWKLEEVIKAVKYGYIDNDAWKNKINENVPVWAVLEMLNDIVESYDNKLEKVYNYIDSKL
jgi:N-acetylmuramoyl-L-alanine amidase